ncbi:hypothetical protein DXG01_012826, partial [Tephrocybe rancida]
THGDKSRALKTHSTYKCQPLLLDLRRTFHDDSRPCKWRIDTSTGHRFAEEDMSSRGKSTTIMWNATKAVSYSKTKVAASKLSGHASVQCLRLAEDHAANYAPQSVHKDPEPRITDESRRPSLAFSAANRDPHTFI